MPAFRPDFSLILFYTCRRFPIYIGKCFYFVQMFSSQTQVTAAKRLPIYETILLVNFFFLKKSDFCMDLLGQIDKNDGENVANTLNFSTSSYVYCMHF